MEVEVFGYSMSLTWFLVCTVVFLYLASDTWSHTYWRRKGVVYEPPWPVIGNMPAFAKGIPNIYNILRKKHGKVYGVFSFQRPILIAGDPDLLKLIMVKNFGQFHDRIYFPQNNKEMMGSIASLEGERWREVRNLLAPTFSTSKMKQMAFLVNNSADHLVENIGVKQKEQGFVECKELFGSYVMDTIGSCAFGMNIDSQRNPDDPFVANARRTFKFDVNNPLFIFAGMFPILGYLMAYLEVGLFFPTDVMTFFKNITTKAVALRKKSTPESSKKWIDFLQLMMDAQDPNKDKVDEEEDEDETDLHAELDRHHDVQFHSQNLGKKVQLTDDELIGQAITFFTAGYETTTTLLGFVFYSLAQNPEIQEKLIQEVDEITPSRDSVGYRAIASMPYLDQVVCETLRIFPPATLLSRLCNETITHNGLTVEKGVQIFIPVYTIHHDADYWPEPEKFYPDRFIKANREKRHPFAWLPFGAGPHNCIGMRFALMEAKTAITRVLQKYRFETCAQTEIPPIFGKSGFLSPPNGITLRAVPRTDIVG